MPALSPPQPVSAVNERKSTALPSDFAWLALICIAACLIYLPCLGSYGVLDPTDSFFVESAREMVETGQYLLPLDNYKPWLDKPILAFWLMAASCKLFGSGPLAVRLVSAVSAILLSLLTGWSIRSFAGKQAATFAALIFLTCPLSALVGHLALTDMTLSLLISGCLLHFFRYFETNTRTHLICAYLFCGLAVLCKGPVALVIVGLTLAAYIGFSHQRRNWWSTGLSLRPVSGAAIVAAVNLPWYIAAIVATHGSFFYDFFIRQNLGRMLGTVNHQEPWWFYLPVFVGGLFPWSFYVFAATKISLNRESLQQNAQSRLALFCLCWAAAVICLFGSLKTKLPTYILPAVPAIAVYIALQLDQTIKTTQQNLRLAVVNLIAAVGCLFLLVAGAFCLHGYMKTLLSHHLVLCSLLAASLTLAGWLFARAYNRQAAYLLLASSMTAAAILVPQGLMEFHSQHQSGFDRLVAAAFAQGGKIAIYVAEQPSLSYTFHHPIPRLPDKAALESFAGGSGDACLVFVPRGVLGDLPTSSCSVEIIQQQGKWSLVRVKRLRPPS